ncbi:MAG TPA: carbohydrate deacetylase [Chloroflexi bacterium]|nr:carbohydrate deacetylase [Chloroflexota bacterium]
MLRQLIVNADDFGVTAGGSRGIIKAHNEGIVTSTSVMINMPAAAEAVEMAQKEAPSLGLGLHLNLTAGPPVAPPEDIPDLLTPEGTFPNKHAVIARLPTLDIAQVERELRAQVEHFIEVAGHAPDHLDSHHHVTYLHPGVAEVMFGLAHELGIPIRNPLPGDPETAATELMRLGVARSEMEALGLVENVERLTDDLPVSMPDHFISEFFGERVTLGDLLNRLMDVEEGVTELMCHPGEVDDALRSLSSYTDPREAELAALTHPSAREVINSRFIQLITFADLGASSG